MKQNFQERYLQDLNLQTRIHLQFMPDVQPHFFPMVHAFLHVSRIRVGATWPKSRTACPPHLNTLDCHLWGLLRTTVYIQKLMTSGMGHNRLK